MRGVGKSGTVGSQASAAMAVLGVSVSAGRGGRSRKSAGRKEAALKESVARQLDFGADAAASRQSSQVARPASAPGSPAARVAIAQRSDWASTPAARCGSNSPQYAVSASDWTSVDWDSSLSREVAQRSEPTLSHCQSALVEGTSLTTSQTLIELSPLRSDGCSFAHNAASQQASSSQVLPAASSLDCPRCGSRIHSASMPVEASTVANGRPHSVTIERVSSSSDGGSIWLQLRVGAPARDQDQAQSDCGASATETLGGRSAALRRYSSAPQLHGDAPTIIGTPPLAPVSDSPRPRLPVDLEISPKEQILSVQALRERYLQQYCRLRPWKQIDLVCRSDIRSRAASDSRCRRRCAGSRSGPRVRTGRNRMSSRLQISR